MGSKPPSTELLRHNLGDEAEEWTNLASMPNAVHRFVFVPRGRGLSFYVTFVLDESGERAYAMWEQSRNSLKFAQFACTVPTQQKFARLSAIKTIRYESFITRSG